jgi:DNA-binding phage protein
MKFLSMPKQLAGEGYMVVHKKRKLTKDRAKALVASGLQRAVASNGIDQVSMEACVTPRCIQSALSHDTLPEYHTLLNALDADPTTLDESLAEKGFCLVPLEMDFNADMEVIAELSGLLTEWLGAMKDGNRDHIETQQIAARIRYLLPKLRGVVGEADRLRSVA